MRGAEVESDGFRYLPRAIGLPFQHPHPSGVAHPAGEGDRVSELGGADAVGLIAHLNRCAYTDRLSAEACTQIGYIDHKKPAGLVFLISSPEQLAAAWSGNHQLVVRPSQCNASQAEACLRYWDLAKKCVVSAGGWIDVHHIDQPAALLAHVGQLLLFIDLHPEGAGSRSQQDGLNPQRFRSVDLIDQRIDLLQCDRVDHGEAATGAQRYVGP